MKFTSKNRCTWFDNSSEYILIYEDIKFYLVGEYNKTQEAQYKFEYRNFDI